MLDFLTAILAFAAIMIMLSTLITVLVETAQKWARLRRKGFQQMLEALYETVVRGWIGDELEKQTIDEFTKREESLEQAAKGLALGSDSTIGKSITKAASDAPRQQKHEPANYFAMKATGAKFAEGIMRNPSVDWGAPRSWLGRVMNRLHRFVVTADFENMDTRQFIEQLANTKAGDQLAALNKKDEQLENVLRTVAYQFERFGEAASDYFARRAWVLSVFIALAVAFVANVDAVRVFRTLVLKPAVSQQIVEAMNALEQAEKQAKPAAGEAEAATPAPGQADDAEATIAALRQALEQAKGELAKLNAQGVPVGRAYFPFCNTQDASEEEAGTQGKIKPEDTVKPGDKDKTDGATGTKLGVDADACKGIPPKKHYYAKKWKDSWLLTPLAVAADWFVNQGNWLRWLFWEGNGWSWLFSTILAGALIGLGAPFWYDIYRKAALVLPIAQVAGRFVSTGRKAVTITPPEVATAATSDDREKKSESLPKVVRRVDKATIKPEELVDAFKQARANRPPGGVALAVGDSQGEMTGDTQTGWRDEA